MPGDDESPEGELAENKLPAYERSKTAKSPLGGSLDAGEAMLR